MDKYKGKTILTFLDNLKTNGVVSKDEVLTLESAIGEDIITSSINVKELTTSPSKSGYEDVYAVINKFVESENITTDDITTVNDAIRIYNFTSMNLRSLKRSLEQVSSLFSDDVKSKMLDSKDRYSFYNENGEVETNSYDILEDYNGPRALLFNKDFISGFSNVPSDKVVEAIKNYLPEDLREPYSDSWYKREVFGLMSILFNSEIVSVVVDGRSSTYVDINGRSYISVLENSEELIKELTTAIEYVNYRLTDIISGAKNDTYIGLDFINRDIKKLEKFNTLFTQDRTTMTVFNILSNILSQ